jgi:hypothetical protein
MVNRGLRFVLAALLVAGCSSGAPTYPKRTVELTPAYHGRKTQGHAAASMTWFAKKPIHLASADGRRGPTIRGLTFTLTEDNDAVKDKTNTRASVSYTYYNGASHRGGRQKMTFHDADGGRLGAPILSVDLPTWDCWYNKGLTEPLPPAIEEKDEAVANNRLRAVSEVWVVFAPLSDPAACSGF